MEEIKYQKIKLYTSLSYIEDKSIFDERIKEVENILKKENIEYVLEITDEIFPGSSAKSPKILYTLNLLTKFYDKYIVEKLLNDYYNYEYEVVEIEEEDTISKQGYEEDVIQNSNFINEPGISIKEKIRNLDVIGKVLVLFVSWLYILLIIFEISLILEAGIQTGIIIAVLIETYIYLKSLNGIINKKGE